MIVPIVIAHNRRIRASWTMPDTQIRVEDLRASAERHRKAALELESVATYMEENEIRIVR